MIPIATIDDVIISIYKEGKHISELAGEVGTSQIRNVNDIERQKTLLFIYSGNTFRKIKVEGVSCNGSNAAIKGYASVGEYDPKKEELTYTIIDEPFRGIQTIELTQKVLEQAKIVYQIGFIGRIDLSKKHPAPDFIYVP